MIKVAWHPVYAHTLPAGHRFPMEKYNLLYGQLMLEGLISEASVLHPELPDMKYVRAAHSREYLEKLMSLSLTPAEIRKTGFPLSQQLIDRELIIMDGTMKCVDNAFEFGAALNIAGGTHHAFADRAEGFCLLNDLAIAALYAIERYDIKYVLIIDLDVHQGNGTAAIFANHPHVFTFSMHGASNYPLIKEKSDIDIALPDQTDDQTYLSYLQNSLLNIRQQFLPELILYQSGVDVLATDKLGKLALSLEGCRIRDQMVFAFAKELDVPIVAAMGGGYSPKIGQILEAHMNTFRVVNDLYY